MLPSMGSQRVRHDLATEQEEEGHCGTQPACPASQEMPLRMPRVTLRSRRGGHPEAWVSKPRRHRRKAAHAARR